ncbi:sensor histidine kinase [Clostridium sp.]|uniref:sensor histidine kinase n=1 Tax=Clostridium sp. TaxID=1506 RepID=UPI003F3464E9
MQFQENDERIKIIIYVSIALILQGILVCFIYYKSIDKINDNLKKQNFLIASYINKKDENLTKDIIPIITGKNLGDDSEILNGENILSKYSYNDDLTVMHNPIIGEVVYEYAIYYLLLVIAILIVIIYGIMYLINPIYKEIKYLTYRAENIVENKIIEKEDEHRYKGSLDRFIIKFLLMEDRIHNSLDLLQQEKINLKNIINDISHQLKTPLMAITMYSDIIKDHREMNKPDIDNFINLMDEQLTRMDWLVKTLLKYARLECNVVEYNKEEFLLNNTIEESINPLRAATDEKIKN